MGSYEVGDAGNPGVILDLVTPGYPAYVGFRVDAVRVTGSTLRTLQDLSSSQEGGGTHFRITLAPVPGDAEIFVEVDLGCGAAAATKRYRILTHPIQNGFDLPSVEEVPMVTDAGTAS